MSINCPKLFLGQNIQKNDTKLGQVNRECKKFNIGHHNNVYHSVLITASL